MKRVIIMASVFSFLSGLFSSGAGAKDYKVADPYAGLRNMVLTTKPEAVGLKPDAAEVWGILMETGYPEAVATLVALADGTVSIYFSNGGGIIGLGPHPELQKAGKAFLSLAQQYSRLGTSITNYPLPEPSYTRFYFLTGSGVMTVEAKEDDLGYGRHQLAPLFHKGHELISEIRVVDEKRRAEQDAPGDAPKAARP
ncbi:MAG: hypothetical protein QY320_02775 [Gammaproteobacteria bacterium]|nr:MAG: hypothetical protein QY320_02775 [Gammaproteobacteria bacterium]